VAIEHLLAALERDAAAERDAILGAAREEAAGVARNAEERLARLRQDVVGPKERELRAAAAAAVVEARRRARGDVLAARDRLLSRVRAAAVERLPAAVADPRYTAVLPTHFAEAVAFLGDGRVIVRCAPAIADRLGRDAATRSGVTVVPDPRTTTGFTIESEDGAVVVDNGLEARLARLAPRLAIEIAAGCGVDLGLDRW
jgi:vacuolar-type H+-ATPase subunit E/Vma4